MFVKKSAIIGSISSVTKLVALEILAVRIHIILFRSSLCS